LFLCGVFSIRRAPEWSNAPTGAGGNL